MSYRLSQKKWSDENDDVLHHDPAFEECNLDDTQADYEVDDKTAAALAGKGIRLCGHCFPSGKFGTVA